MVSIERLISNDIFFSLLVISGAFLGAVVTSVLSHFLMSRVERITFAGKFRITPEHISMPLRSLIPSIFLLSITPLLRLGENLNTLISDIANLWFISASGWLLIRIVRTIKESFLNLYDINTPDNLKARSVYTQIKVIENIVIALIVFLTASFILMSFEQVRQIGASLLASAGILGIILGFAAQKTLGNFIAGLQIALAQPIRIDDVVIVENEWGWIEEITLTYVVVRIWDLRRLVIPISYFIENPFQNWTRTSADILGSVFLHADYTVPVEKIREELTRILENSPYWDKKVNVLQVTNADKTTVELRALMSARTSPMAWDLRCEVREKLLTFLQKNFPESLPKTRIEMNSASAKSNRSEKAIS